MPGAANVLQERTTGCILCIAIQDNMETEKYALPESGTTRDFKHAVWNTVCRIKFRCGHIWVFDGRLREGDFYSALPVVEMVRLNCDECQQAVRAAFDEDFDNARRRRQQDRDEAERARDIPQAGMHGLSQAMASLDAAGCTCSGMDMSGVPASHSACVVIQASMVGGVQ